MILGVLFGIGNNVSQWNFGTHKLPFTRIGGTNRSTYLIIQGISLDARGRGCMGKYFETVLALLNLVSCTRKDVPITE